jgi:hypothetical protein
MTTPTAGPLLSQAVSLDRTLQATTHLGEPECWSDCRALWSVWPAYRGARGPGIGLPVRAREDSAVSVQVRRLSLEMMAGLGE